MSGQPEPPPPLAKLLRQLSSDARSGVINAAQKSIVKTSLLLSATQAAVNSETGGTETAPNSKSDAKSDVKSKTDEPVGAAEKAASEKSSGAETESRHLVPLLRQLSAAHASGLIDSEQKTLIRVRIIARIPPRRTSYVVRRTSCPVHPLMYLLCGCGRMASDGVGWRRMALGFAVGWKSKRRKSDITRRGKTQTEAHTRHRRVSEWWRSGGCVV